jgi:hypothetical protein
MCSHGRRNGQPAVIPRQLYNIGMSDSRDEADLFKMYTAKMGQPLGPFFHHLWQDLAHLHLTWNEYLPLFGKNQARFDTMNKAAPGFFGLVHDMWWNDILLMLWKLTDKDTRTLSVLRLPDLTPASLHAALQPKIDDAVAACKFAHRVRHNLIAHRNADIAMGARSMPTSSRAQIQTAVDALDEVFSFLHRTYTNEGPVMWEHLDARGGSEYMLWIVRRGLKARDDDFESHKPPMRFDD